MYCESCKHRAKDGSCDAGPNDACPAAEDEKHKDVETVVPCPRCGRDCDGYGAIDGIPVCPNCDAWLF
jgi:hypothetical protein